MSWGQAGLSHTGHVCVGQEPGVKTCASGGQTSRVSTPAGTPSLGGASSHDSRWRGMCHDLCPDLGEPF